MNIDFKSFVESYLAAATWTGIEPGSNECEEFTKGVVEKAHTDCCIFAGMVLQALGKKRGLVILNQPGTDVKVAAAHDFWLSRGGFGSGFLDRGDEYGGEDINRILNDISQSFHNVSVVHLRGPKSKLIIE